MGHQRRIQVVASHVKKKTSPGGVEKASPTIGGADDQKIIPKKSLPCIYLLGSCIMDIQAFASHSTAIESGGSVDGFVSFVPGGVALNIARALSKICTCLDLEGGMKPPIKLFSVIGNDSAGHKILSQCLEDQVGRDGIVQIQGGRTATVVIMFDGGGDVVSSVADVEIVEKSMNPMFVAMRLGLLAPGDFVVVDGDLPAESIEAAFKIAKSKYCKTFFEPVSITKAIRARNALDMIDYISPNLKELVALTRCLGPFRLQCSKRNTQHCSPEIGVFSLALPLIQTLLEKGVRHVLLTAGAHGAAVYFLDLAATGIACIQCPALESHVKCVNGAGDCLVGAFVASRIKGDRLESALAFGVAASWESLRVQAPVPPQFDSPQFQSNYRVLVDKVDTHYFSVGCCCESCMKAASTAIYQSMA